MGGFLARGLPLAIVFAGLLGYIVALAVWSALVLIRPASVPDSTLFAVGIMTIASGVIASLAAPFAFASFDPRGVSERPMLVLVGLVLTLAGPWIAVIAVSSSTTSIPAGIGILGIALLAAAFR